MYSFFKGYFDPGKGIRHSLIPDHKKVQVLSLGNGGSQELTMSTYLHILCPLLNGGVGKYGPIQVSMYQELEAISCTFCASCPIGEADKCLNFKLLQEQIALSKIFSQLIMPVPIIGL